jgi:hypothetical protein
MLDCPDDGYFEQGNSRKTNDQPAMYGAYLSGKFDMVLDWRCEIFQCMFGTSQNEFFWRDRLQNHATKSVPCIAHCNGGPKEPMGHSRLYSMAMHQR